jgi:hypothetical protein
MRTAYWPDVHTRIRLLEKFLDKEYNNFDQFVFTGDFFDDWYDSVEQNRQTAIFLRDRLLYDRKIKVIPGNHDNYYRWADKCNAITGSKFSWDKCDAINEVLKEDHWWLFRNYTYIDGWLASHAGFAPSLFWPAIRGEDGKIDLNLLDQILKRGYEQISRGQPHFCFLPGEARGGDDGTIGGPFWQCWEEIIPLPGVKQIVGHTAHKTPKIKYYNKDGLLVKRNFRNEKEYPADTLAVDLDTHSKHYGVVTDGKLTVHRTVFIHEV